LNLTDTFCHRIMTISTSLGCTCKWINGNKRTERKWKYFIQWFYYTYTS